MDITKLGLFVCGRQNSEANSNGLGGSQAIKTGVGYKY
jgi:hypothetical protein